MIWILSSLDPGVKAALQAKNPFVDVHRSGGSVVWSTSCRGHEIRNGLYCEIRKVRVGPLDSICGGLVSDSAEEGFQLIDDFYGTGSFVLVDCRVDVQEYCRSLGSERMLKVAVPVRSVFAYFSNLNPRHLDVFDPDELHKRWGISVAEYLPRVSS